MTKWTFTILFFFILGFSFAQTEVGLKAYFSFDDCTADESRADPSIIGVINGNPTCETGVSEKSLKLNGINDHLFIAGLVNAGFQTEDFSISLYFRSLRDTGLQTIIYKSDSDCASSNYFAINHQASTHQLNIELVEDSNKSASIFNYPLTQDSCWQHIVLVRQDTTTILYVNGQFAAEAGASSRVNIRNNGVLTIGKTNCSVTNHFFEGMIDEVRFYNRALEKEEIEDLHIFCGVVSTENEAAFSIENQPTIYPNPTSNTFQIDLPLPKNVDVKLTSVTGQIVLEQADVISKEQINISFLPKGIYLYELKNKKREVIHVGKLLKL